MVNMLFQAIQVMVNSIRDMPKWGTPTSLGLENFRSISGVVD